MRHRTEASAPKMYNETAAGSLQRDDSAIADHVITIDTDNDSNANRIGSGDPAADASTSTRSWTLRLHLDKELGGTLHAQRRVQLSACASVLSSALQVAESEYASCVGGTVEREAKVATRGGTLVAPAMAMVAKSRAHGVVDHAVMTRDRRANDDQTTKRTIRHG